MQIGWGICQQGHTPCFFVLFLLLLLCNDAVHSTELLPTSRADTVVCPLSQTQAAAEHAMPGLSS